MERFQNEILLETKKYSFSSILDIGLGKGEASEFFLNDGKVVTATGFDIKSYNLSKKLTDSIKIYENVSVEKMGCFKNEQFDAVWCSHVLEHTQNPGIALKEIRRVLKNDGILFLMVPPYLPYVVGGHVTPGWNIGILMYNLIMSGFNVRKGSFVKHNYNLVAFVKKGILPKVNLRYDSGDIDSLSDYFPDNPKEKFNGNLKQINWSWTKSNNSILTRLKQVVIEDLVSFKESIKGFFRKFRQDTLFSLKQSGNF